MLPDVGSMSVPPGRRLPSFSAASIEPQRDAVLDRAARVEQLELGDDLRLEPGGDAAQAHQRRLADRVQDRVSDVGLQRRVRGHGCESTTPRGARTAARARIRIGMRSLPALILLGFAFCLLLPSVASAGGYSVTACFGPENGSWAEWEPSPFATAYTACPGGALDLRRPQSNEGMMVRNVVGAGVAPRDAAAALRFDAPPGTAITGLDVDVRMTSNPGWDAGIHDAWNDRWLWCGQRLLELVPPLDARGAARARRRSACRRSCAARRSAAGATRGTGSSRSGTCACIWTTRRRRGSRACAGRSWRPAERGCAATRDAAFDAADNSGVRVARIELDGRVVHEDARACDFTRPVPCGDGGVGRWASTRAAWGDGEHVLRFAAVDAGGNWAWVDRVVRVDNTAPAEVAPVLEGGSGWSPLRARRLTLPLPGGQAAPLVRARVKACRLGGGCEDSAPALEACPARPRGRSRADGGRLGTATARSSDAADAAAVPVAAFDGPGEYAVRVALEDAAGNVGPFAAPVTLRFDDTRPGRARRLRGRCLAQRRRAPARRDRRAAGLGHPRLPRADRRPRRRRRDERSARRPARGRNAGRGDGHLRRGPRGHRGANAACGWIARARRRRPRARRRAGHASPCG